ncbi:MAG: leucine-rich repeat protein, partial [Clostridia bacterium]|nr:leucine-rich repeat protein [Clostridia bacterium]
MIVNVEVEKIFADDDNVHRFTDDIKHILSKVHLLDGMDFANVLYRKGDCDRYFDLPEEVKPKAGILFGVVKGIDKYISVLDGIVRDCGLPTETNKILNRIMGDNNRFKQELTDEILKMVDRMLWDNPPVYAMCLLSTRGTHIVYGEDRKLGLAEVLWLTKGEFNHRANEMLYELHRDQKQLLVAADELKNPQVINAKLRNDLQNFVEGYLQLSQKMFKANLLLRAIPFLDKIAIALEEEAKRIAKKLENGEEIGHILCDDFHAELASPVKYKFCPEGSAESVEREPLKYKTCHDGIHVYGGSLIGSGFVDFTKGVTLPCEIDGVPVTEFSGTFNCADLQHIEAWCLKRVSLVIHSDMEMMCIPPSFYGGMRDTVESVSLAFEAPNMHCGSFEGRKDITHVKFSGTVTEIPDWDYGYFEPAAFKNCTNLISVCGVFKGRRLGDSTFENCVSLVEIPELQIASIGDRAFFGCRALTEIIIPESVKEIGVGAFDGIPGIVIKGYVGTAVEKYAKENGITFVSLTKGEEDSAKYDLSKYTEAHRRDFETAFAEIKNGKKQT